MKKEKFGMILPITLLAYFLIIMDNSIIFTSSVEIQESLNISATDLSWISNAYTLTFGGFLLLSGRLSDLIGRKKIFIIGLIIFMLSSLLIGVAVNAQFMVVMRAFQGIGSSILAPTTLALMMDNYQGEQREKAISYYGATAGIGSSIGLLLGGGLTSLISWRAGFLINVPFTLILLFLTFKYVKETPPIKTKIDYIGSLLSVIALTILIFGLINNQIKLIIVGILILLVFIYRQSKITYPILPLELFSNNIRTKAYLVRMLFMMAMLPYWFILPQIMQNQYHFSALQAGMGFLPLTVVNFIVAMKLPALANKYKQTQILLVGSALIFIGLVWTSQASISLGYFKSLALPMILIGAGQGLVLAPITSAGVYKADDSLAGVASGLTNTMHQIGGPIGLSIIVATTTNFKTEFLIMSVFMFISFVIIFTMKGKGMNNEY
ncbi:MFS transporter [Mycoplasma sp. P36-A1]|uniref:MFS transporter n=1 Tax=Mycoplasma sp. P36-A1 TaxID=3252900 RepID=UPI003C30D0AB